ncbi:hypothetical protein OEZ71_15280 [Defluviimonas sp. WL0050]|uniref:Chalcone isomerase domain-containing protein n=1 Tax=Albidovulum litorale TaxID=2984134 RepID=A0ABT2ZR72_9RHOB|nr:hypothetical protein [Defluviimonas sp. WL0050]MCV2873660.1 hypothetical protein [Defluviimonas sp. WL0050]
MPRVLFSLFLLFCPAIAQAVPVSSALRDAELRGQATLRYFGFPLYHARLYTPEGKPLDWQDDLALELTYLRGLTQTDLVEATLREIGRTGAPLPVKDQLARCFDDVGKGDRYLAVSNGPDEILFWRNDRRMCALSHPQIKQRFMAIFLGDDTRSPGFTRKLRGQ